MQTKRISTSTVDNNYNISDTFISKR